MKLCYYEQNDAFGIIITFNKEGDFLKLFSKLLTERFPQFLIAIGFILLCIILPILYFWCETINFGVPINKEAFSSFGQFASGVIGSLWALAGVILFYIALKEQRSDFETNKKALDKQIEALSLQAEQTRLQQSEIEYSRTLFKEQAKSLQKNQFETTFFSLLDLCTTIVSNLDKNTANKDYFCNKVTELTTGFNPNDNPIESNTLAINKYKSFYFANKHDLAHYFQTLYRLFCFINNSTISDSDKIFYSKIVRAQFRESELFLLYYNAHTPLGQNFSSLILKYNLLKHLPSLSKLELKSYCNSGDEEVKSNRLDFCGWSYLLISQYLKDMEMNKNDLIIETPFEPISVKYNNIDVIMELAAKEQNCLKINLHLRSSMNTFLTYLNFSNEVFSSFFKFFLFDILYLSNYCSYPTTLTIEPKYFSDNHLHEFIINSNKKLYVLTDEE